MRESTTLATSLTCDEALGWHKGEAVKHSAPS